MQEGIKQHPDFASKIYNDPIELLKVIKILMHSPIRAQYPLIGWMDALNRSLNTKQDHNESLSDYYARFGQEFDTIKSIFGTKIFDQASEKLEDYTNTTSSTERDKIKKISFNAFASVVLLRNSDQNNYGTLLETMTTTLALGTNVFPKTKEKALDAMSNHKIDQNYIDLRKIMRNRVGMIFQKNLVMVETRIVSLKNRKTILSVIIVERKVMRHQIVLSGRKFPAKTGTFAEFRLAHRKIIMIAITIKSLQLDVEKKDGVVSSGKLGSVSTLAT
jgi:hypothetical protein